MSKYLFKDLIKCTKCGKNYNVKNNNGAINYICQTRKNRGKDYCDSEILKQDFLIEIIQKNRELNEKEFNQARENQTIKSIEVNGNDIYIEFKDGAKIKLTETAINFNFRSKIMV